MHKVSSELPPESQKFQPELGQQTLESLKCGVSELKEEVQSKDQDISSGIAKNIYNTHQSNWV